MKIFVYSLREYDERVFFDRFSEKYGVEYGSTGETPCMENAYMAEGYDAIDIITSPINKELVDKFYELGVRCIATRTIGYDHIDYVHAREIGMGVVNITYSPSTVADYTVMMILMGLRKIKHIVQRTQVQDYTLKGKIGRELRDCKVGVIGAGKIGERVISELSGFECKVYTSDPVEKESVKAFAEYVEMDQLIRESDIITLHVPGTLENYHMLGAEAFANMKEGVGIVNCARGMLIDSQVLIENLESGKVGFACLDTIEDEHGLYYFDRMGQPLDNRSMAILKAFPNVIVTPHMAFYTDEAVSNMVENSIVGSLEFFES